MRTPAARLIWGRIAPAFRECVRPQQPFALLAIAGLTTATAPRLHGRCASNAAHGAADHKQQRAGNVCSQGRCGLCRTDKPAADNRGADLRVTVSTRIILVMTLHTRCGGAGAGNAFGAGCAWLWSCGGGVRPA